MRLSVEYQGFNPGFDEQITECVGLKKTGSGFFIPDQIRDISFEGTKKDVLRAKIAVEEKFPKVKATIYPQK